MRIRFLGHAAFFLTTSAGRTIVTDPYEPGGFDGAIGYGPLEESAELVTVSHDHADHNCTAMVPGNPRVISQAGHYSHGGVTLESLSAHHDARGGAERGANTIWLIEADGLSLCHLGDLGHPLGPEDAAALSPVNVLFVPVGGVFTIDAKGAAEVIAQLRPNIAIPMHYLTPKCGFKLAPVDAFLAAMPRVRRVGGPEIEVAAETLPEPTEIVVLDPAL